MPAFSSRVAKKVGNILGRGQGRTWDPSTADWWVSNRSVSQACCPGKSTPSPHLVTAHTLASACFWYSSTESSWNSSSEQFCNEAVAVALSEDIMKTHTHKHTCLTALFLGLPRWAGTRKLKPICIYWSKRHWVAVASAGPYASLHLAPDR